ncbi:MAG: hypothetical protein GXO64_04550 [Candidatus Micrarchaeota archaeon]|nr:hypothetical protein [Candidatus Micrarchaeota archaeon]
MRFCHEEGRKQRCANGKRCIFHQSGDDNSVECPFGRHNDPYPGKCGRYVDGYGNGICDLSE